jgi:hypothetical protein
MDLTTEEIAALPQAQRLKTIEIQGRTFHVGILSPEQLVDIEAFEARIARARMLGEALGAAERDPTHILVQLLWAGDRTAVYKDVLPFVTREHLLAAKREEMRQRLHSAAY